MAPKMATTQEVVHLLVVARPYQINLLLLGPKIFQIEKKEEN